MGLNVKKKPKYCISYIVNKRTDSELFFINEINNKIKKEYEIKFNIDETYLGKQGELIFTFLTADFSTEKTTDKTFFNKLKNVGIKLKEMTSLQELQEFQAKFQACVDFTFFYQVVDEGYDVNFKEHMRHSDELKSLRDLRDDVNVYLDIPVINANGAFKEGEENIHQNTLYVNDVYNVYSVPELLYISLKKYVEFGNLPIRKCRNCDQYFIARNRKDELYCTRIYKDTKKTCKKIGSSLMYIERLGNDPAMFMYRNMTKKKLMQVSRNKGNTELAEKYAKWKEKAKHQYEKYKLGGITDDEFINWLSKNDYQIKE